MRKIVNDVLNEKKEGIDMDRRNEKIEGKYLEGHHYDYKDDDNIGHYNNILAGRYKDYMSYYLKKLKR